MSPVTTSSNEPNSSALMSSRRLAIAVTFVSISVGACGSSSSATTATMAPAATSSTATPSRTHPSQQAVLITDWITSSTYTIRLIAADGQSAHSIDAKTWSGYAAGLDTYDAGAAASLPTSETADRVYYLDGDSTLRYVDLEGRQGQAAKLPGSPTSRVAFSVSPDDSRIAIAVFDWSSGFTEESFVEDVGTGAHRVDLFSENTNIEEPMGWQGRDIVYGVGLARNQYDPGAALPTFNAYHVLDSTTGHRIASVCDGTDNLHVFGHGSYTPLPTAAGVLCGAETPSGVTSDLQLRSWSNTSVADFGDGSCVRTGTVSRQGTVALYAGVSYKTNGSAACNDGAMKVFRDGVARTFPERALPTGWVDEGHVLAVPIDSSFTPPMGEVSTLEVVDTTSGSTARIPGQALFIGTVPSQI